MAGGIIGGLLGGMLFSSLGFAGGPGGFGSGGFGLMDLMLLGGIAFLIFWFIRRSRARQEEATAGGRYMAYGQSAVDSYGTDGGSTATLDAPPVAREADMAKGLGHLRQMDPAFDEAAFRDTCTDLFFQIQAAWMRQDMEKLKPVLAEEMLAAFREQLGGLKAKGQINKLENITVRSIEMTEVWQEQGKDFITVRFLANLLDYTVDQQSGRIVEGSDSVPVKFEEYWTWVRPVGPNAWRLSAINQVD
jgi:predicted lipid-binding transport protein (Tim44 family)